MEPGKLSLSEILYGFSLVSGLVSFFLLGVFFDLDKYEDTAKVLSPIFLGIVGLIFTYNQFKINASKARMELFDKRFGIYLEFIKVIRKIRSHKLLPPIDPKIESYTEEFKDKMKQEEKEAFDDIDNMILSLNDNIELSKVIMPDITDELRETQTILNGQNYYKNLLQRDRIDQKNTTNETFYSFKASSAIFLGLEKNFHLLFKNYFKV